MIKFFRLRNAAQTQDTVVVVAEDTEAGILLRWVPNTGLWHRATELENDYLFGDDGGTYEPITADDAGKLLRRVAAFDGRREVAQRILARYRAQPPAEQHTNAEMGLAQKQTRMKPMSAPGLGELLRRSAQSKRWRVLALYPGEAGSAPRQFVSEWARRPHPLGLENIEMRVSGKQQAIIIQARAVSKTSVRTPPERQPFRAQSEAFHA